MGAGREVPSARFTPTATDIAEFADAIRDPSPVYRDLEVARAAGYEAQIAPPTFSFRIQILFAHQIADSEGLSWESVLHGGQEFEFFEPLVAGRTYDARAHEVSMRGKPPLRFITIETDLHDAEGTLVQRGRSTLISREEA